MSEKKYILYIFFLFLFLFLFLGGFLERRLVRFRVEVSCERALQFRMCLNGARKETVQITSNRRYAVQFGSPNVLRLLLRLIDWLQFVFNLASKA